MVDVGQGADEEAVVRQLHVLQKDDTGAAIRNSSLSSKSIINGNGNADGNSAPRFAQRPIVQRLPSRAACRYGGEGDPDGSTTESSVTDTAAGESTRGSTFRCSW